MKDIDKFVKFLNEYSFNFIQEDNIIYINKGEVIQIQAEFKDDNIIFQPGITFFNCGKYLADQCLNKISKKTINSDEFFDFINKTNLNFDSCNIKDFPTLINKNVILKLFSSIKIINNLDNLHESVKYDRNFLIRLFNDDITQVAYLDFFRDTLFTFRNDETIVGKFAKALFVTDQYTCKYFFDIIKWDMNDFEKIKWLAVNNVGFIDLLTNDEQNKFLESLLSSFTEYTIEKCSDIIKEEDEIIKKEFDVYILESEYNKIVINLSDSAINIRVRNKGFDFEFIKFFKNNDKEYNQMKNIIFENIKEIENEKGEEK